MFTNVWYTAAFSKDVTSAPKHVKMLGRDFVLFRDADGAVHCLSNVCCHRGAPLSQGVQQPDGTLACCQHGWRFGGDGRCSMMPALPEGGEIPKAARVDSYPVEERYNMIWVLLGDDPDAAAPIPDIPEFSAEGWRWIEYEETWDANYHWAKFSNLDYVHLPVVHGQTWNGSVRPPAHKVEYLDETSIGTGIRVKTKRPKGLWSMLRPPETEVQSRMKFYLSGFTIKVDVEIGGAGTGMRFVVLDMSTPIDENTTTMRFLFGRNFMPYKWADKGTLKRNLKNVREDQVIAEAQLPRVPTLPDANSLMTDPEDEMVKEYWSIMEQQRGKGWQIDHPALEQAEQRGSYHVIPSPARKADPESWVYKPVPRVTVDSLKHAAE